MTAKSPSTIKTEADTYMPDNSSGLTSNEDIRTRIKDLADSALFFGENLGGFGSTVSTSVSGTLVKATHSGCILVTSGNVTVPHAAGSKGFYATLVAGGAHTVSFNSTTSAAMATGDMMTVAVQDDASGTPKIRAVLVAAADQVAFT